MTKTTSALKLAEEAAEFARNICLGMNWSTDLPDEALAAIREALADHSGDANEMVMDWSKVKPEAIKSDPMYQMGYAAAKAEPANTRSTSEYLEPVRQEPVAWHHPQCEGQCIACLIEKAVQDAYGTQGRDYMLRHINAAPVRTKDLTDIEYLQDAAPDLLEALQVLVRDCGAVDAGIELEPAIYQAQAAIAKATGGEV